MADDIAATPAPDLLAHGAAKLSRVSVDAYNAELRTPDGFVGDRASKRAFFEILDKWREPLRALDDDPFGEKPSEEISKKKLDALVSQLERFRGGKVAAPLGDMLVTLARGARSALP